MRLKEFLQKGSIVNNWDDLNVSQRKNYIYSKLQNEYNMTPLQSAAIVGNLLQENGKLDTKITNNIGAFGIAQWYKDRKQNLLKKENPYHIDTQIQHLVEEIKTNGFAKYQNHRNNFFSPNTTLEEKVIAFRKGFERPGEHEANDYNRIKYAKSLIGDSNYIKNDNTSHFDLNFNDIIKSYEKMLKSNLISIDDLSKETELLPMLLSDKDFKNTYEGLYNEAIQEKNEIENQKHNEFISKKLQEKEAEKQNILATIPVAKPIQDNYFSDGGIVGFNFKTKNNSVNIKKLNPVFGEYFKTLEPEYQQMILVTSGNDSKHSKNSTHYNNNGLDLRWNEKLWNRVKDDPNRVKMGINLINPDHGTAKHFHFSYGSPNEAKMDVFSGNAVNEKLNTEDNNIYEQRSSNPIMFDNFVNNQEFINKLIEQNSLLKQKQEENDKYTEIEYQNQIIMQKLQEKEAEKQNILATIPVAKPIQDNF